MSLVVLSIAVLQRLPPVRLHWKHRHLQHIPSSLSIYSSLLIYKRTGCVRPPRFTFSEFRGGGGSVVVASIAVASITGRFINRFKNESYNYNILTDNLDKDWILVVIHNTQLRDYMQAFIFYILFPHMARFLNFSSL